MKYYNKYDHNKYFTRNALFSLDIISVLYFPFGFGVKYDLGSFAEIGLIMPVFFRVNVSDLGWDRWVVYPESITFVQCQPCGVNRCSESPGVSAQVNFLYIMFSCFVFF